MITIFSLLAFSTSLLFVFRSRLLSSPFLTENFLPFHLLRTRKQMGSKTAANGAPFAVGRLDQKNKDESLVANNCISFMIDNVGTLFKVRRILRCSV